MLVLRSQMVTALMRDTTLVALLNVVPNTDHPAMYVQHIGDLEAVLYGALSLFDLGGPDTEIKAAENVDVTLDIWVEEAPSINPSDALAYGLAGAETIYRRCRKILHMAHLSGALRNSAFSVAQCEEIPGSAGNLYESPRRLHHYFSQFRARVLPVGAEIDFPNS